MNRFMKPVVEVRVRPERTIRLRFVGSPRRRALLHRKTAGFACRAKLFGVNGRSICGFEVWW